MIPLEDAQQYLDMGSSVSGIALEYDVFNANKLVRDAGEVTNSYVYIKELDRHLRLYVSRYPDDSRHYVWR